MKERKPEKIASRLLALGLLASEGMEKRRRRAVRTDEFFKCQV
jgi:hypothetical protein